MLSILFDTLLTMANSPQFSLSHVKWKWCFVCSGGDDGLWLFPGSLAVFAPPYFHHLLIHDGQEMYFKSRFSGRSPGDHNLCA